MKNKNGFTLVELLVAITIGILIVGFGAVALNDYNEKQKVEIISQELMAELRLARNYAITEQFPESVPANTNRVVIDIDSNGLMTVRTQKDESFVGSYSFPSKKFDLKGITITVPTVKFSVTNGRSIDGAINIGISGVIVENIKIDESGLIYEEE